MTMDTPGCTHCAISPERRDFLARLGAALGAIALSLGADARLLQASATTAGVHSRATEKRYPIPAMDGAWIDRDAEVILVRWQNALYAFALSCPHQNTALKWNEKNTRFQCPKHKSRYQPDGTFIDGRATRNMDRYSVTREDNTIVVQLDRLHESDTERSGWSEAVVRLP